MLSTKMRFTVGRYTYYTNRYESVFSYDWSDPSGSIKNYDHLLYQSLDKIFREHCLCNNNQVKEFLRSPQMKSIIDPILEQEPLLIWHFSKEEFEKLSLLWISVLVGYDKSAELLVRAGADVNEPFGRRDPQMIDEKWTVLYLLLQMDPLYSPENERLIRLVVDHGADLQARDHKRRTVLHYAIEKGQVQMTEMLLEKGADVNAADSKGMTPLLVAVGTHQADEMVPLLIKYGASIFAKDIYNKNALHHLATYLFVEHVKSARVLIDRGISLEDRTRIELYQPIHEATRAEKNELVKLLLDRGADVNARTKDDVLPVHIAAQCTDPSLLLTLLRRGANVDAKTNESGQTALHNACSAGLINQENKIKILLSAGADILVENRSGRTPFGCVPLFSARNASIMKFMLRTLALKKASLQPSIELKDEQRIKPIAMMWNYYQDCYVHISRAKATSIVGSCTIFKLLTKCHCWIASHMWNRDFESKFRLCDVNGFSMYAEDILEAFEGAQKHYQSVLEQVDILNEAVYYMLPHMTVRKVVHYMLDCDSCQMKKNRARVLRQQ